MTRALGVLVKEGFLVPRAIFLKGARIPSMAEELATDFKTMRARRTGSRR